MSGRTHGVTTETSPARNATGSFSAIESCERLVDAALVLLSEACRAGAVVAVAVAARTRPCARRHGERGCAERGAAERQHPREQVEAVGLRRRQDRRAELGDHRVEDLLLGL